MLAVVEELLPGDLVVVDRVDADLLERESLAAALARDVEGEVDGESVRPVEERPADLFPVDRVGGLPALGLLDDRRLAGGLPAVALDRNDAGRVHRAHDLEVLPLV